MPSSRVFQPWRPWGPLTAVAALLLFAGNTLFAQAVAGTKAVGQKRSVVNLSDIARRQAQAPPITKPLPVLIPEGEPPEPYPVPQSVIDEANRQARLQPQMTLQSPAAQAPSPSGTVQQVGRIDDNTNSTSTFTPPSR